MNKIKQRAQIFLPILQELTPILTKVPNEVTYDEERGYGIKLGGFYKDNVVTVWSVDDQGLAHAPVAIVDGRYEQLAEIFTHGEILDAIIGIHVDRFRYWSEVKPADFDTIDEHWLPLLKERGLVKEQVSYQLA